MRHPFRVSHRAGRRNKSDARAALPERHQLEGADRMDKFQQMYSFIIPDCTNDPNVKTSRNFVLSAYSGEGGVGRLLSTGSDLYADLERSYK